MMRWTVDSLVGSLAEAQVPQRFQNPYVRPEAAHNLVRFLSDRDTEARTVLLVGEAPGYRGAVISGVPLSSAATLIEEWQDPWNFFGPKAGFRMPPTVAYRREATATIVWRSLAQSFGDCPLPLTWNAVPFHPLGDSVSSNGSVHERDLEVGIHWLRGILDLFPAAVPVAVGRRAEAALSRLNITHRSVRHPSRGGKSAFERGMTCLRNSGGFGDKGTTSEASALTLTLGSSLSLLPTSPKSGRVF